MKEFVIRILLIVVSLSLFVLAEFILRTRKLDFIVPIRIITSGSRAEDWREFHMFSNEDFIPDPYLFWKLNPKNKLSNSKGFIGPEFNSIKPDATIRIFCIGDSNTMGTTDGSYPLELGSLVQSRLFSNKKVEVINAGIAGYSSLQGLRLCFEIMKYNPDLVTICFGWNDPCFTSRKPDKMFRPVNKTLLGIERFFYRFKTYQLLRYIFLKLGLTKRQQIKGYTRRVDSEDYESNLIEMVNLTKTNRVKLLFITRPCISELEPWMESFVNDTKFYNSIVRLVAKRLDIDIIDAEIIFCNHQEYFFDSCHFNREGGRLLAEKIYDYIKKQFK